MAITMRDIANCVGISVTTVSKVLGNKDIRVAPETRAKIQETAKVLGYVSNAAGVNLRSGQTNTIAVIVGDLLYPYYSKLLKEISHLLRLRGKSVVVCDIDNNVELLNEHLQRLKTGYVDGAILIPSPSTVSQDSLKFINLFFSAIHVPTVVIFGGGETFFPDIHTVGTDPFQCGFVAVEYLVALGHRSIGFVSEMSEDDFTNKKLQGYRAALEKNGIAYNRELVRLGFARYLGGHAAFQSYKRVRPTAIICSNDQVAIGCCKAATSAGVQVPRELSIIGMDNTMATEHSTPEITTVNQDVDTIAQTALEMLFSNRTHEIRHITLQPEIVIRDSCQPPEKGKS